MRCHRARWPMLLFAAALASCSSGGGDTAGNTELNVIVPNNESAPGVPAPIDIQTVGYTIHCLGNSDAFLDNNASFPDEVQINGNLEVVDGRTSGTPPVPTEIWQGFMDLPPGPCTAQLRARDGDGEVICTATEPFNIVADTTTKINMVLLCDLSYQAPVGMLDVDATFSFNVGNFCPDLFVLNCLDSFPAETQVLPPPNPPLAGTQCEARFRDGDSSCGQNCDPQTCAPSPEGLTCTPGPDPGVSTTLSCTNALLDCNGDGTPESSCTWNGNTLGTVGDGPAAFPGAPPAGTFFVTCIPPTLGGIPGAVPTCTAVTTDGDVDCDKTKVVSIACPGLAPCDPSATPPPPNCDDGAQCTADSCNSSSGSAVCENNPVADGTPCNDAPSGSGLGLCLAGACGGQGCTVTGCGDDGNDCTDPQFCSATTQLCEPDPPVNTASGTVCNGGTGLCDGAGVCIDNCTGVNCSDGDECTQDLCDTITGGVCSNPPEPDGTPCNGGVDACQGGACLPVDCTVLGCPDDGNECTEPQTCNTLTGSCEPDPPANAPLGSVCNSGNGQCDGAGICVDNCTGVDCSDGDGCTQDLCDSSSGGICSNLPQPDGTPCTAGFTGTCQSGVCIDNCFGVNCSDGNDCTQELCDSASGGTCINPPEPAGAPCTAGGICDGNGNCTGGSPDYPPQAASLTVGCTNNVTADISILPYTLTVDPGTMTAGSPYTAELSGVSVFDEAFLDAAQAVIPGGVRSARLIGDLAATVAVRSGATGADVQLGVDPSTLESRCELTDTLCDPTNDVPGNGNTDCPPQGSFNLCLTGFVDVPTVDGTPNGPDGCTQPALGLPVPDCDCTACLALDNTAFCTPGLDCVRESQCRLNGFCVAGNLLLPLDPQTGSYTADATSGTPVRYGWFDAGTVNPDGTYALPPAVFANPPAPIGARVSAAGLFVALQCLGAVSGGGPFGVGVPGSASPTPDVLLITFLVP